MRKDVETDFWELLSRLSLLASLGILWNRKAMRKVVQARIIIHSMIVELHHDGYKSSMCSPVDNAVDRGTFLDENDEESPFTWNTKDFVRSKPFRYFLNIVRWKWIKSLEHHNCTDWLACLWEDRRISGCCVTFYRQGGSSNSHAGSPLHCLTISCSFPGL